MFEKFYDTKAELKLVSNTNSYTKDNELIDAGFVMADIQPNRFVSEQKQYGLYSDAQYVMYYNSDIKVQTGMKVFADDNWYTALGTEKRRFGMKVYLKKDIQSEV